MIGDTLLPYKRPSGRDKSPSTPYTRAPPLTYCSKILYTHLQQHLIGVQKIFSKVAGKDSSMKPGASKSRKAIDNIVDESIRTLTSIRSSPPGTEVFISTQRVFAICREAQAIFLQQPVLLELSPPIQICGDIHGQFSDLLRIFEIGGCPSQSNYIFLGDYVDRAKQGTETMLLLLCYKIKYPRSFFLLRGNHECSMLNKIYGFYDECKRKYSVKVWRAFIDCFNALPAAAVIDNKIFCTHGGLSPEMQSPSDVFKIQRPCSIKEKGLLCDLLWSDPVTETDAKGWGPNPRGVSYTFGPDVIHDFLTKNSLELIVRAHQVVEDGYEFGSNRKIVTLFSAPNYCGEFDNAAAIMVVGEDLVCSFRVIPPVTSHTSLAKPLFIDGCCSLQISKGVDNVAEIFLTSTADSDTTVEDVDSAASLDSSDSVSTEPPSTESASLPKRSSPDIFLSYEEYIKILDARQNARKC